MKIYRIDNGGPQRFDDVKVVAIGDVSSLKSVPQGKNYWKEAVTNEI